MLIVVQCDHEVPAGSYADDLAAERIKFMTCRAYAGDLLPALPSVQAVIVLGGAMGVHDTEAYPFLISLKEFIGKIVTRRVPYLGICLGGQLLADVLGGRVVAGAHGERGMLPVNLTPAGIQDPLFSGISSEFVSFQWHNDSFALPERGVLLASSPSCPNQAFRLGSCAYGLQFHPEVTAEIVACWAGWVKETASGVDRFLADFAAANGAYRATSRRILQNFLSIAGMA